MPSRKIFRPQNCGAVAHTLPATGRVEDDPKLSRLYNRFYAQGDRSITSAERAADRKLARLRTRSARTDPYNHDHVVCLDCGYRGKTLRRHIASRHGLTRDDYLKRWGLKSDHPLTAPR